MSTPNPIPSKNQPRYHESSALRSPRDSDSVQREWRRNQEVSRQAGALTQNVAHIQRQLDRMRRFQGGGGGTGEPVWLP